MRGRPRPIAGLSLVLAALLTLTTAARGMSVQTTGGITYFTCTTTLPACEWIEIGPVTRSGFNLTLTMYQKQGEGCVLCIDCYHTDTNTAVLGSLPPGTYQLIIYMSDPLFDWEPFPLPYLIMWFEVPASADQTVTATRTPAGLRLNVAGVTGASYIVESSSTLTNWTGIHTNTGAPFHLDVEQLGLAEHQFYRVRVLSDGISAPAPAPAPPP